MDYIGVRIKGKIMECEGEGVFEILNFTIK